ncbi:MAG: protein kinase [Planctomycetaceae bacterium]|jgi:serine/threonine-protein kinase|nr:protein kinase [Planctomycetaceae bacterium]
MESSGELATPASPLFCVGCNLRLRNASSCPRCGGTIILGATDCGTVDTAGVSHEPRDDPEQLVGHDLDRYHIELLLGMGGMGCVYLARHRDLLRRCALKVLQPRLARRDSDYVERFLSEGRTAAALVHPHVVTTHAVGETDGFHFLEMEFVAGRSLQHQVMSGPAFSPAAATRLLLDVATGLGAAHQAGIVHRDLKPDNIMLTEQGQPKISDFGLAKLIPDKSDTRQCGTPHFMAPELLLGTIGHPGSDVYALGVCYYQLLTGQLPFARGTLGELRELVTTAELPPPIGLSGDLPLEMVAAVRSLMHKSPEQRPADGIAAAALLSAVLAATRDIGHLIETSFTGDRQVQWQQSPGNSQWSFQVALPDGRSQLVFVELSDSTTEVLIYSTCCPAESHFDRMALERNSQMQFGRIAVRRVDDAVHFVVTSSYPRATVDAEELYGSIHEIAREADRVERELTNADNH